MPPLEPRRPATDERPGQLSSAPARRSPSAVAPPAACAGKRITSRIDGWSVSSMISRSMPEPDAAGRRHAVLQRAQVVLVAAAAPRRRPRRAGAPGPRTGARWSSGSLSSLKALASSRPADEQLEPLGQRRDRRAAAWPAARAPPGSRPRRSAAPASGSTNALNTSSSSLPPRQPRRVSGDARAGAARRAAPARRPSRRSSPPRSRTAVEELHPRGTAA